VYRVTIPLTLIFTVVGDSAKNYAALAVARTFAGLFSGLCLTVGVGILNDLWDLSLDKTGSTFAVLFASFNVFATQMGPMVSSSLVDHHSWRWTFWTHAILIGIITLYAIAIPETYVPDILRRYAKKNNLPVSSRGSSLHIFLISVGRPGLRILAPNGYP
jgi:MFS family permease